MKLLRMQKSWFLLLAFLLNCTCLLAQKTITGKVTKKETGQAVEGASIEVKGSKQSTLTNEKGEFKITVASENDVLVISHIGMVKQEVKVGARTSLMIGLPSDQSNIDDVVVVGYTSQKRSKLTGAVATVKPEDIQDLPVQNIAGALRGRVAGLGVSSVSGRPGAGITLNIRDAQSASDIVSGATAEPLYVIDNMIVGKSTFDNLDPTMVQEITILKDAAAAIYGAAGAKGVVLITTKKGRVGPPSLSYNGYAGISDAVRMPDMLSAYDHAKLLNETYKINNTSYNNFFSDADLEKLKTINYKNWFEEIWQPALMQRHNLSISGGTDRMTYFIGGGYQNQNGNYAGQKADKSTLRSGITAKLGKGISGEINLNVDNNYSYSKNGLSDNDKTFLVNAITVPRWTPIQIGDYYVNYATGSNNFNNPLAVINSGFYQDRKARAYGVNASLVFAPESGWLKGFTARVQASSTANNIKFTEYRPHYFVYNFKRAGNNGLLFTDTLAASGARVERFSGSNARLIQRQEEASNYRVFFTLQYARRINQHDFNVIVGGEQSEGTGSGIGLIYLTQQIPDNDYFWAFDPTPTVETPKASQSAKRSFFSRYSYTYKGRYTLDGITRFDASSNFAVNNIWGVFPTFGASWLISDEPLFKKNVKGINYLKLRANYGITGDDRVGATYWFERYKINIGSYLYNETYVPGVRPDVYPNPDITWEKKKTLNVGVDLALLNNKLTFGFEAFRDHGYDIFDKGNDLNFPMFAGFAAPVVNYRVRYTWGTEYTIGYRGNFGKNWRFTANMNFGIGNSVVQRIFYNRFALWETSPTYAQLGFGTDPRMYTGENYGLKSSGMFRTQADVDAFLAKNPGYTINGLVPEPGWLKYEDVDGDGVITDRDKTPLYNRVDPALVTGIQFGLSYKGFDWRVNIAAAFGGKAFYDADTRTAVASSTKNVPAFWTDTWTPSNPNAKFPRYDDPYIKENSNFWAVDGTIIRINDMTLGYAPSKNFIRRLGLANVRLLLSANNLAVLKNPLKYKDPETVSIYDYPSIRTISFGLNVGL